MQLQLQVTKPDSDSESEAEIETNCLAACICSQLRTILACRNEIITRSKLTLAPCGASPTLLVQCSLITVLEIGVY